MCARCHGGEHVRTVPGGEHVRTVPRREHVRTVPGGEHVPGARALRPHV